MPPARTPWLSYLYLAASMSVVGGYVGLSKLLVVAFPVFLLAWLRFAIATVAMAGWLRRAAAEPKLDARDRRLLFLESFFGNFLFSVCMLFGIARSTALAAGVVMAALPAVVALLSWGWLGERITARVALATACAVFGIALVSLARPADSDGAGTWAGNLLLLGAVCCEAIYVVIGKQLTARIDPNRISALINLWGLALVTPFGLWQAFGFDFAAVAGASWTLLFGYSIAASVVTVWLWMTGLKQVPASTAGIFTVLLPVSAALVGVVWLGERFSLVQAVAFTLALVGIVLATWPTRASADTRSGGCDFRR